MKFRWRTGLFRLWVVISVIWVLFFSILVGRNTFNQLSKPLPAEGKIARAVEVSLAYRNLKMPPDKEKQYTKELVEANLSSIEYDTNSDGSDVMRLHLPKGTRLQFPSDAEPKTVERITIGYLAEEKNEIIFKAASRLVRECKGAVT